MITRVCTKCEVEQPLDSSHYPNAARKGKPHRFARQCRNCQRERSRRHYHNNKQDYKDRAKKWDADNPDRVRANRLKWEEENRERVERRQKEYRSRPESIKMTNERSRKYRRTVEGRFKESVRSKVNSAIRNGTIQKPDSCEECGKKGYVEGHHEDYNKPLDVDWLCKKCHWDKHRLNDGHIA